MVANVQPSFLNGSIQAPASKSSMQRACAAALLSKGTSTIINPGISNDDKAAKDVIQKLGAVIQNESAEQLVIISKGVHPVGSEINCGESGLGIRMFTPIASLSSQQITIQGSGSLVTRPMHFFDEIFPQLGIRITSQQGKLPLQIQGPLQPANIEIDGSLSSQFLTGLLMAYGAAATKPVTIKVNNLKSKPYIDLTLQVMEKFGVKVTHNKHEEFYFDGNSSYQPQTYIVESDWSSASFLLVAGAVAGNISVRGLDVDSTQADKAILQALTDCGCNLSVINEQIDVSTAALKAFQFNATDCPDLFPPLVVLAAYCQGTTSIVGVKRLAHKESDRGITLQDEFAKLGVSIILKDDLMLIEGCSRLRSATVHSRHDHRIAMACAVAALKANGPVIIQQADAVNKSYPNFYEHLQMLGAAITLS